MFRPLFAFLLSSVVAALATTGCGPSSLDDCIPVTPRCLPDGTAVSSMFPGVPGCPMEVRRSCALGCSKARCIQTSLTGAGGFPVAYGMEFTNERTWTQAIVLAEVRPPGPPTSWEQLTQQEGRLLFIETPLHFAGPRRVEGGIFNGGSRVVLARGQATGPILIDEATEGQIELHESGFNSGAETWGSVDVRFDGGAALKGRFTFASTEQPYDGGL